MNIHRFESGQIDFERTIRGYAAEMDMEFRDAVSWLSKRPSLSVAANFLGMEHTPGDVLRQLGKFLDKHGYTVPKLSGDLSNKEKGLPGTVGAKRREHEEKANGDVATSRLSTVEKEQYRTVNKGKPTEKPPVIVGQGLQRRNEGESTVGTMTLTREEYLAERKAGKSNSDIARAQGITGPALVYHLNKWGLKDSGSVEKELAKLGAKEAVTPVEQPAAIDVSLKVTTTEVAATVEPSTRNLEELIPPVPPITEDTNTSSAQTHAQPVNNTDSMPNHPPEAPTEYIMIRVPVRFDGWESYKGKLPVDRDRLITEGTVSIQYATAWAYREMLDLFGDGATLEHLQSFLERKVGEVKVG